MRKTVLMNASQPTDLTPTYLPAVVPVLGTVGNSVRKLKIALRETPGHICGQAQPVGYTGTLQTDLAIYRLRVKSHPDLPTITLSGFFVLENGLFHPYTNDKLPTMKDNRL